MLEIWGKINWTPSPPTHTQSGKGDFRQQKQGEESPCGQKMHATFEETKETDVTAPHVMSVSTLQNSAAMHSRGKATGSLARQWRILISIQWAIRSYQCVLNVSIRSRLGMRKQWHDSTALCISSHENQCCSGKRLTADKSGCCYPRRETQRGERMRPAWWKWRQEEMNSRMERWTWHFKPIHVSNWDNTLQRWFSPYQK